MVGGAVIYRYVKIPGLSGSGLGKFPGQPSSGENAQNQQLNNPNGWTALNTLAASSPQIIKAAGDAFGGGDDDWGGYDEDPYYNPYPYPGYA